MSATLTGEPWIKIVCTLGPSSLAESVLRRMDELGVSIFRINMSHTPVEDLERLIQEIRQVTSVPLCIDTEGAQMRTGDLAGGEAVLLQGSTVTLVREDIKGTESSFTLRPGESFDSLEPGTLLSVDFNAVLLLIVERDHDKAKAYVMSGGKVGSNKGVTADRPIHLPPLTEKDRQAIDLAVSYDIDLFALSFVNDEASVLAMRELVPSDATIISKVETRTALDQIDGIIRSSDAVLIDRGDLSRDVPVEHLPFVQKRIIGKAHQKPLPAFVATNLLESMVWSPYPSRAEVSDVASTLLDGANGLVLAAETAIGRYPVQCVSMVKRLIAQYLSETWRAVEPAAVWNGNGMLTNPVLPHGGSLAEAQRPARRPRASTEDNASLVVGTGIVRDAEQIALGTYSPLSGFMTRDDIDSVLDRYTLSNGTVWTLPIVLKGRSRDLRCSLGDDIELVCSCCHQGFAILTVRDVYVFDTEEVSRRWFGSTDQRHPGVAWLNQDGDCFIGGEVTLLRQHSYSKREYCLSPTQVRAVFAHKGWSRVVGFHTRNTPHRAHEYIQMKALERTDADGLLIQPVLGQKKKGDFTQEAILAGYEALIDTHYPKDKVHLTGFFANSWYSGPREAVFTAICRKNFGCSHFIVGRDHTGVGDFYGPSDVMALFDRVGDIGITPVFFDEVAFDAGDNSYREVEAGEDGPSLQRISGMEIRRYIAKGQAPPEWMMRPEVSETLLGLTADGVAVFEP